MQSQANSSTTPRLGMLRMVVVVVVSVFIFGQRTVPRHRPLALHCISQPKKGGRGALASRESNDTVHRARTRHLMALRHARKQHAAAVSLDRAVHECTLVG